MRIGTPVPICASGRDHIVLLRSDDFVMACGLIHNGLFFFSLKLHWIAVMESTAVVLGKLCSMIVFISEDGVSILHLYVFLHALD